MTLVQEKVAIMSQVSSTVGAHTLGLFQTFSSSLGMMAGLTPPVAELNQVLQAVYLAPAHWKKERGSVGGTPLLCCHYNLL